MKIFTLLNLGKHRLIQKNIGSQTMDLMGSSGPEPNPEIILQPHFKNFYAIIFRMKHLYNGISPITQRHHTPTF